MTQPSTWILVVPVKHTSLAKTRLADYAGALRPDLARAMAVDTVAAAVACDSVKAVVVVTDDPGVADDMAAIGALVFADEPNAGLNPALQFGFDLAHARWPGHPVASVSADLPALTAQALQSALAIASGHDNSFVADGAGIGTTLAAVTTGQSPHLRFGARSRAAHRSNGWTEIDADGLATLRRDVDTEVDLWDAKRLGVGPATRAVLDRLATVQPLA